MDNREEHTPEDVIATRKRIFAEQFVEISQRLGRDYGVASRAYRRAHPTFRGTIGSLYSAASGLLRDPEVVTYIKELREGHKRRHQITVDRVIEELESLATYNPLDYFQIDPETGKIEFDLKALDPQAAAAISSITTLTKRDGSQEVKVTWHDKNAPLQQLCRILGINKDNINLTIEALDKLIAAVRSQLEPTEPEVPK